MVWYKFRDGIRRDDRRENCIMKALGLLRLSHSNEDVLSLLRPHLQFILKHEHLKRRVAAKITVDYVLEALN